MATQSTLRDAQSNKSKKTQSAGISNRPPAEEHKQQEQLPPRGQAKKRTSGRKGPKREKQATG